MAIKEYKLKELADFKNYKIINSNYHVSTDNMNGHDKPKFYPKKGNEFKIHHILMSNIRPYFNKVWYANKGGSRSPGVLSLEITNKEIVIPKFLYYYICSDKFNEYWNKTSKGTTMPVGDKDALLNYSFKIPDIQQQQEIINIIEPKEPLFLKYHEVVDISDLDKFDQSWSNLINIIEPFEKLREQLKQKINNVDLIFQNVIQSIKTKSKIVDLASINAGQSPPQISKYWKNGKIPFININDLTNNMYVFSSNNFINDLAYSDYRCKPTTNFSILVGKVSPDKNKISVIDDGFIANGAIRILEPLDKNVYGQLFEGIRNKAYILSKIACGSVQQQINSLQLSNLEINFDSSMNEIFNIQLNYKKILLKLLNVIWKIILSLIELYVV